MKTRQIVYTGMYLALFYVLDVITKMVPLLKMPQGGSVGLSVVALLLASYHLGWKNGVLVGVLSIFIQYLTGDVYMVSYAQFFLDYLLAFGVYGLASVFPNTKFIYWGILITSVVRFLAHVVSGSVYYGTTWWGSITYNAPYMIATTVVAMILVPLVYERVKVLEKHSA